MLRRVWRAALHGLHPTAYVPVPLLAPLELLAEPLVRLDRLFEADEAVAVGVDAAEVLLGAQPLAARDVAVAVDVGLAEPQRPRGPLFPGRLHVLALPAEENLTATRRARAQLHLKQPRQLLFGESAVLVGVPGGHA